jgi:hypothetical protein
MHGLPAQQLKALFCAFVFETVSHLFHDRRVLPNPAPVDLEGRDQKDNDAERGNLSEKTQDETGASKDHERHGDGCKERDQPLRESPKNDLGIFHRIGPPDKIAETTAQKAQTEPDAKDAFSEAKNRLIHYYSSLSREGWP